MPVTVPGTATTANLDSAADDPKLARADLKDLADKYNSLRAIIDALGITQVGDGLENDAQGTGVKDKTRVKLDGTSTDSGLARSASGIKIAAQGVTLAMLKRLGTAGQVLTSQGTGADMIMSTPVTGEANVGTNLGTGVQVYGTKTSTTLPFRTLLVSVTNATSGTGDILSNVDLAASFSQGANEVTLSLTLTRYKTTASVGVGGL